GLVFATSAASSVVQPLFGLIADRAAFRWLLPASILLTGTGVALGSQSPNYPVFFVALILSGLGVAAFHPEAARQVHLAAGPGRRTWTQHRDERVRGGRPGRFYPGAAGDGRADRRQRSSGDLAGPDPHWPARSAARWLVLACGSRPFGPCGQQSTGRPGAG